MEHLDKVLQQLPQRHRDALLWFARKTGTEQKWPGKLADGTLLASKAKAIYKPDWTTCALSIRQNLSGRYPDQPVVRRPDGTWSYLYFQEGIDPDSRDSVYTNRGLLECKRDKIPVGVMVQSKLKPSPRYRVLGLALVVSWSEGYFGLEGFSDSGISLGNRPRAGIEILAEVEGQLAEDSGDFNPNDIVDARKRALREIAVRGGQKAFREQITRIYGGKCAITGYSATKALEAAHIIPYLGPDTDNLSNGLLLRADIHTLFDLGLIAVDSSSMKILLARELMGTEYSELEGKALRQPDDVRYRPSKTALDKHRALSEL